MCRRVGRDRILVNSIRDGGSVVTVGGDVWLRVLRGAGAEFAKTRQAVGLSGRRGFGSLSPGHARAVWRRRGFRGGRRGFGSLSPGPSAVSTVCHRRVVVGLCRVLGFAAG